MTTIEDPALTTGGDQELKPRSQTTAAELRMQKCHRSGRHGKQIEIKYGYYRGQRQYLKSSSEEITEHGSTGLTTGFIHPRADRKPPGW